MAPSVAAVHRSDTHSFSKRTVDEIELVAGVGVAGDAHAGARVKHRSRVRVDPDQPNLRQVHLMHRELFDEAAVAEHGVGPGDLGENVTTEGIDVLGLPVGSVLRLGPDALVAVTGLRNPCGQIDGFGQGLRGALRGRDQEGNEILEAGIMAVVVRSGVVRPGDEIVVALPPEPHRPLQRV